MIELKADTMRSAVGGTKPNVGNWREWNRVWSDFGSGPASQMLYIAGQPASLGQFWQQCYFQDLWELLGRSPLATRCLELGSGRGTTSMYLAHRGCQVTMVDLAPSAFAVAKTNFETAGVPLPRFLLADARDTGLPQASYDCVYNIGLLEHFEDPLPVLRESWRLLDKGGLLFSVIVPARRTSPKWLAELLFAPWRLPLRPLRSLARRFFRRAPAERHETMVRTAVPRPQYMQWMRELGCSDVDCIPYNPYHGLWHANLSIGPFLKLYRLHYESKRQAPRLRTWACIACCDLLICRK